MTSKQKLVAGIMALVVFLWITDKSLVKDFLGFSLGLGGIAISGAVLYMLFGLTSWKDYEDKVSWGVIVLYAGCISLGIVFKIRCLQLVCRPDNEFSCPPWIGLRNRSNYINVCYWSCAYQFNECRCDSRCYRTSGS